MENKMWRIRYVSTDNPPVFCEAGTRDVDTFTSKYDENGVLELHKTGKVDLYSEIQSHADSVNIYVLLKRYQMGDVTALSAVQGHFGDFSEFPQTYAEVLNVALAGERAFYELPLEVREKFGHSYQAYIASAGSAAWFEKLGIQPAAIESVEVKKEVISDEP